MSWEIKSITLGADTTSLTFVKRPDRAWGNITLADSRIQAHALFGAILAGDSDKDILETFHGLTQEVLDFCREMLPKEIYILWRNR